MMIARTFFKFHKPYRWHLLQVVLLAGFLSACNAVQPPVTPTGGISSQPSPQTTREDPQSTVTPTQTAVMESPQPTATVRPSATATPTSSPTYTPLWEIQATLPAEVQKQNLIELFSTNGGCDFPCWWGIAPGDSYQKIIELGPIVGETIRSAWNGFFFSLSLEEPRSGGVLVAYNVDSSQIVQSIEVELQLLYRFREFYEAFDAQLSLPAVLQKYGKPSEVWLIVEPFVEPPPSYQLRDYYLYLLYEEQNFGIAYEGYVESEDPIRICTVDFSDNYLISIYLYIHNQQRLFRYLNLYASHDFLPLETAASMSVEEFYQIFSKPDHSRCIETNLEKWDEP